MSSGSGSGSGANQHLLALLRAIRLRRAAPDALAAGIADAAEALTQLDALNQSVDDPARPALRPREAQGDPREAQGELPPGSPQLGPPPGPHHTDGPTGRPGWASGPAPRGSTGGEAELSEGFSRAATSDFFGPSRPAPAAPDHVEPPSSYPGAGRPGSAAGPDSGDPDAAYPTTPVAGPGRAGPPGRPARPPATGSVAPPGSVASTGSAASTFDHGPQLRPAGLPPFEAASPDDRTGDQSGGRSIERAGRHPAGGPVGPIQPIGGPLTGVPAIPSLPGVQPPRPHGVETPLVSVPPPIPHAVPGRVAGSSADGMDPADDELLRETQRLLSTSLTFAGGPTEVAERFRDALLRAHPALIAALPGGEQSQIEQFALGLTWLAHHLDHPPVLVAGCRQLGAALFECGIPPQQLQLVGAALAESMRAGMAPGQWRQDFDLAWRSTWQHVYEWIRYGETLASYQPTAWSAVVVTHEVRRPDLAVIRLRPHLPMPFRPGQFARIEVPGQPGNWRPYSLTGAPRRDDIVEMHVRAKTQAGVSGTLVYRTRVGDTVRLSRPEGGMVLLEPSERNLLLIAGDTGVVPLKALLTELAATGDPRSAVLFWGVRTLDELYDITEIAEIARAARRATVVPVISEGAPGPYASGLVTDAVAAYGEWSNHEVYLAGPPLMLAATSAALKRLGVDPDHIHYDPPE